MANYNSYNKELNSAEIVIDVWGDFAMFTRPESKVERTTYYVPTPSACRGILNAIYSKPIEFYYEITKIEIMNPIRTMSVQKNEIKSIANSKKIYDEDYFIDTSKVRTQRISTYLRDVYYRIHASIIKREDAPPKINIQSLKSQFERRVNSGKCFFQPCFGTKECMCFFSPVDVNKKPLNINQNLGIMLYDVFDITNNIPLDTSKKDQNIIKVSFFNAEVKHGVIDVPNWGSEKILVSGE